jgi:hypothetical protein
LSPGILFYIGAWLTRLSPIILPTVFDAKKRRLQQSPFGFHFRDVTFQWLIGTLTAVLSRSTIKLLSKIG